MRFTYPLTFEPSAIVNAPNVATGEPVMLVVPVYGTSASTVDSRAADVCNDVAVLGNVACASV